MFFRFYSIVLFNLNSLLIERFTELKCFHFIMCIIRINKYKLLTDLNMPVNAKGTNLVHAQTYIFIKIIINTR